MLRPIQTKTIPEVLAALKKSRRNESGFKDSANMWRTINGQHFVHWTTLWGAEELKRTARYRAAGIRCRRFGEELFIHHADSDLAISVDATHDH